MYLKWWNTGGYEELWIETEYYSFLQKSSTAHIEYTFEIERYLVGVRGGAEPTIVLDFAIK